MKKRLFLTSGLIVLVCVCAILLPLLDRYLSRSDRIRSEKELDRLILLMDSIYRYERKFRKPPDSLWQLVPGFAPEQLTTCVPDIETGKVLPITWDKETGKLSWPEPLVIHGLRNKLCPLELDLVFPERPQQVHTGSEKPQPQLSPEPEAVTENPVTDVKPEPRPAETETSEKPVPETASEKPEPAELIIPETPEIHSVSGYPAAAVEARPSDIVLEAEHFQSMSYGWQIITDPTTGGSAYIHIKEGVGDFESERQLLSAPVRTGDFYNSTGDNRRIDADLYFRAPEKGIYHVYVRTMAHRSSCSNITHIKINSYNRVQVGHNGSRPFVWLWDYPGMFMLKKGVNRISFQTHQDDVKVDQILLSPEPRHIGAFDPRVFKGGMESEVFFEKSPACTVNMSLTNDTRMLVDNTAPVIDVYLRKNSGKPFEGTLRSVLQDSGYRSDLPVSLPAEGCLYRLRLPFEFPGTPLLREYNLSVELYTGSARIENRTLVLKNEFDWNILGPFPSLEGERHTFVHPGEVPKQTYSFKGKEYIWSKFSSEYSDPFGLQDFARMFAGDTFHGPEHVSLFAYTEVRAKEGTYILKAMGDDDLTVWVNGREVIRIFEKGPPIRTAREIPVYLSEGVNRILYRLEQKTNQWQAQVFFRNKDQTPADVVGVPFAEQALAE